jgi:RNA polymerase sigma-70 factor (ECF subfamily)
VNQRSLVELAKQGDHDAFAMLAGAAVGRLVGASRLILRDPELARDAAQNALIRAWRDLPALRDPDRFDAWLHRLTVNACLDIARRNRRRPIEVDLDNFDPPLAMDHASSIVEHDMLDRALRRLDPRARAIVVLHYYVGLPLPEVADILQMPLGTAKSRLHRSLASMRMTMDPDGISADVVREGVQA